jgi:hypothetical protein
MSIHISSTDFQLSVFQSVQSLQATTSTNAKILFIGRSRGDFASLQSFFERRGGHCSFVRSAREGLVLFGPDRFNLILDMTPFQSDHAALTALGCANCSVYRCCQVEIGFLWLPVVSHGEKCFGSAALRPKEFMAALEKTIAVPAYKVKAACQ